MVWYTWHGVELILHGHGWMARQIMKSEDNGEIATLYTARIENKR